MLAVDIDASAAFHASAPRTLFTAPPALLTASGQYAHGWDVSPDGLAGSSSRLYRFRTRLPRPSPSS
jgi:hypothetical protein